MSIAGLRKLEAVFGMLITIMALTFGYEVIISYLHIFVHLAFLDQYFATFLVNQRFWLLKKLILKL